MDFNAELEMVIIIIIIVMIKYIHDVSAHPNHLH